MRIHPLIGGASLALIAFNTALAGEAGADFSDLTFLVGDWRGGGDDFIFDETWTAPAGGVMTGMARGAENDELRVLEYILITKEEAGMVMRFKHFNADYSTWEANGPVTLQLTDWSEGDVTFTADPPSETVKSIRYRTSAPDRLHAEIGLVVNGEEGGFDLLFERVRD